ncbi:MAG: hypothetical protein B5M51_03375 [Anaerolinea sp. 4484_236]|nr:MAG: hypothetical protein B5M51_03375 [Anaerolinea sp. 4484_236]
MFPPTATELITPTLTPTIQPTNTATDTSVPLTPTPILTPTPPPFELGRTPTPYVACDGVAPTHLYIGGFGYVSNDPPLANNVRSGAGKNFDVIGKVEPGGLMEILEGPECADGWVWWRIRVKSTDLIGWTAEGSGNTYWVLPCPIDSECGPLPQNP